MTGEASERMSNLYLKEFQMLECVVGSNIESTQARFNLGRITVLEGQVYMFWFLHNWQITHEYGQACFI